MNQARHRQKRHPLMETLAALGHGFTVALTPYNLFWRRWV